MNCANHPDRAGVLTIDLPSIKQRTYMCEECRATFTKLTSGFKGKREAWEFDLSAERDYQRRTYGTSDWDFNREEKWK